MRNGPDCITALYDLDTALQPGVQHLRAVSPTSPSSTTRWPRISSIGRSNYHAMLLTLRKRYAGGTQFDINYTLSKSEDMGSQVERGSALRQLLERRQLGLPDQLVRSGAAITASRTSTSATRSTSTASPSCRSARAKRGASAVNNFVNGVIGDWSVAGLMRLTSGFPFNVSNCRSCWATNWNLRAMRCWSIPGVCRRPRRR